jgi:hypothetical protein
VINDTFNTLKQTLGPGWQKYLQKQADHREKIRERQREYGRMGAKACAEVKRARKNHERA